MGLYGKCSYCNTAGHTLQYCVDKSIPDLINGLEKSIANRYSYTNILSFLQSQPAIYLRILARKHQISTTIQKGFLIDQLTPIYYKIHKQIRLCELGKFIYEHLQSSEPLYSIESFRIDRFAYYLYTHLIHEIHIINDIETSTLHLLTFQTPIIYKPFYK